MWAQNRNIGDQDVVMEIIKENNKDPEQIMAQIPQAKNTLRENTAEAIKRGVFGVPSLYIDQKLWWGQDRLYDVANYLCNSQ